MQSSRIAAVLYDVADWVIWTLALSVFWIVFTLAGLVVFGIAPATEAASTLVRERSLGRNDRIWRDGPRFWASAFATSQIATLPLYGMVALLTVNLVVIGQPNPSLTWLRIALLVGLAVAVTALAWVGPIRSNYEIAPWRATPLAIRTVIARPFSSVLMTVISAAIITAVSTFPIALIAAPGTWIVANTLLSLRFFADNEARRSGVHDDTESFGLPTRPLRTH